MLPIPRSFGEFYSVNMVDSWFSPLLLFSICFFSKIELLFSPPFSLILAELYVKKTNKQRKHSFTVVLVGFQEGA